MRDIIGTVKEMIKIIPREDHEFHRFLEEFKNNIFLVLPETEHGLWVKLKNNLMCYLSPEKIRTTEWMRKVCDCFNENARK
ncbi:MAG: hypothetical protein ACTSO3_01405 [Candidatus Heimdallarchaeaceae archaeon]